jgi:energy-converting hydrogenase Eha subunit C
VGTTWDPAAGAVRLVYFEPADGSEPRWADADYQLRDGDYLGSRHHIRAYTDPVDGNWTVMQTHHEHWDWFRLRHTVHSVEDSQSYVEEQFLDQPHVADLSREHFGNDVGSDADGWVTVIELEDWLTLSAGAFLVGSIAAAGRRIGLSPESSDTAVRAALLLGAVITPYLFVRFGAIAVERTVPGLNPKLIVVLFHPVLVVGVPVATYLAARPLEMIPAFAIASLGFFIALLVDYTYLGVHSLPLDTFVYQAAVVAAIGFIAAGASRRARRPNTELDHLRTGVLLWIVVGVLPLLRFVPLV